MRHLHAEHASKLYLLCCDSAIASMQPDYCASAFPGRSLSLLDPTYASKYIPIIASVSEHQPPAWPSYFTDLQAASILMPAGLIALFWPLTPASLFLILYACTAVYFSGVMVRQLNLFICNNNNNNNNDNATESWL